MPWLETALAELRREATSEARSRTLRLWFARVDRQVGASAEVSADDARRAVRRAMMLDVAQSCGRDEARLILAALYRGASAPEQRHFLRALSDLPYPEDYVELGVDACRTNVRDVFIAIAHQNPYPAEHFSDPAFAQMVMKAMFMDLEVEPIVGLDRRVTPVLLQMAHDLARERAAAGRSIPAGITTLESLLPETAP